MAILDEPTSGLDPLMIEAFAEAVHDLKRAGRTAVFLSSHVLSEVEKTCDRVAIVRDGRLMAVRTIAELAASLPRRVTIRFASDAAVGTSSFPWASPFPWGPPLFPWGTSVFSVGLLFRGASLRAWFRGASLRACRKRRRLRPQYPRRVCRRRFWALDLTGPLGPLVEQLAGLRVADIDVRTPSLEDYVLGLYRGES